MKKINVMNLTICFMAFAFLVNASFAEAGSVNVGEVYKSLYKNGSIEVISATEVEMAEKNVILLGEYSFKNGKLRIVATAMGTKMVQYYQITGDGLVDKDGNILYSKKRFAKAAGKALIDQIYGENWSRVRTLLNNGADPNVKDKHGETALMKMHDNYEIVKLLIDHGADANAKANDGWTALLGEGNYEIAKLLIKNGADVNAKDSDGEAALMQAASTSGKEIVKLLIKNGADVNAKTKDGRTALKLAKKRDDAVEIVRILEEAGAKE